VNDCAPKDRKIKPIEVDRVKEYIRVEDSGLYLFSFFSSVLE